MNIIFSSCGNDSVALTQWAMERPLDNIHVVYTNTKWGADFWPDRVELVKRYVTDNGAEFHEIETEGFADICKAKRNQAFPAPGMAFCSHELKILPAQKWLDEHDPGAEATCLVGVSRDESAKRRQWPEWVEESENHGGRSLWSPLVRLSETERNELISRSGLPVLNHKSYECFPCIHADKGTLRKMREHDVAKVAKLESEMGVGKRSGKQKYMFRATSHGGAEGIVEVIKWASHTKYIEGQDDMFGGGCDSGFCGD